MLGKIFLFAGSLLTASMATAGFYVGGGLGSDTVSYKQSAHVFKWGDFSTVDKTHLSGTGIFGTLFVGYDWLWEQFYLATEVNGNLSSTTFKSSNSEYIHSNFSSTRFRIRNSVGVSLLPGYQFTQNTLFYGRLGYTNANFKSTTSDQSLANVSNRRDGFRYGLGIKQAINNCWALRLDYSRIHYDNARFSTVDPLSAVVKNTTISPRQELLEVGVIYRFVENLK